MNATSNGALWMISSAPAMNSTQLVEDVGEARLAAQELGREAVHLHGTRVDRAVRAQVTVELPARAPPVHELDRADLDDAVAELRLEAGGFGVEDDLAHGGRKWESGGRSALTLRRPPERARPRPAPAAHPSGTDASAG